MLTGVLNIGTALLLVQTKGSALASWFAVSAIASGGLLGLFFLAFLTKRAHRIGVYCGIAVNLCFSIWAALTKGVTPLLDLGEWNFPYDELLIGVIGNVLLFTVGLIVSYLVPEEKARAERLRKLSGIGWPRGVSRRSPDATPLFTYGPRTTRSELTAWRQIRRTTWAHQRRPRHHRASRQGSERSTPFRRGSSFPRS